jgi:hypothetical protein
MVLSRWRAISHQSSHRRPVCSSQNRCIIWHSGKSQEFHYIHPCQKKRRVCIQYSINWFNMCAPYVTGFHSSQRTHFSSWPTHTWNATHAKGATNNIYTTHPDHLAKHYKKWKKNRSCKDAIQEANTEPLLNALRHFTSLLHCQLDTQVLKKLWRDQVWCVPRAQMTQHAEIILCPSVKAQHKLKHDQYVGAISEGHGLLSVSFKYCCTRAVSCDTGTVQEKSAKHMQRAWLPNALCLSGCTQ